MNAGNRRRALIAPQQPSSPLWQCYGINGFMELSDARDVLAELRQAHPERPYRIARRAISQITAMVPE